MNEPNVVSISNRYSAAWLEHGTRVTQRQNIIQIYLAGVCVIFGFYFSHQQEILKQDAAIKQQAIGSNSADVSLLVTNVANEKVRMSNFLTISITLLTALSAAIVWMHNRIIQFLTAFLIWCEVQSARQCNEIPCYFSDGKEQHARQFHRDQRKWHRFAIAALLGVTNFTAIGIGASNGAYWPFTVFSSVVLFASVVGLFLQIWDDNSDPRKMFEEANKDQPLADALSSPTDLRKNKAPGTV